MTLLWMLALLAAPPAQDPAAGKYLVKEGRTAGVFYGSSMMRDLWGNIRRQVWTLRADGTLLFGAPEGSFEDYADRALSAEEQAKVGHYSIEGGNFPFSYRDGSRSEGKIVVADDGSVKTIQGMGIQFHPVLAGMDLPLSGIWSSTTIHNNGAARMSTTVFTSYTFFANGAFVHESGASTVGTAIETRTRETATTIETVRQEVLKIYGADSKEKMGRFEVRGSRLRCTYDNGKIEDRYLGRIAALKAGEEGFLVIGNSLYYGTIGVFPKSASGPAPTAPPAPAGLPLCKSEQFELAVPAGWNARREDLQGLPSFLITPAGVSPEDPEGRLTLVLTGTRLDDRATRASDPAMIASLEALVTAWVKGETLTKDAGPEAFRIGEAGAVRLRYSLLREGVTIRIEGACAVRDGNALVALTIATDAALKRHGARARELLGNAVLAAAAPEPKIELQRVKGDGFELDVPKAWTSKELEQNGTKTLMVVPPAGEAEYLIQMIPSEAGGHASAAEPGAIQELRDLVKQLAPAMKPAGDVDTFKAGDLPVSGVTYAGSNEKAEVVLVKAYLVIGGKKAVVLLVVGKETRDKEYGATVRKAISSLGFK